VKRPRLDRRALTAAASAGLAASAGAYALQRRHLAEIAADPLNDRLSDPPRGRPLSVRSADGTRLHAEIFGEDDAPTIVLAHGWTEQLSYWTLVTPRLLQAGFRVCAYDLRGHGDSDAAVDGDYSIERFGEDVAAVLDAVTSPRERPMLVGHSLGAMSIVGWAEHHSVGERVSAVALLNTGVGELIAESLLVPLPWLASLLNRTPLSRGMLSARGSVPKFSTPVSTALIRYTAFGPTATPALVAFYERMLVACPPDVRSDVGLSLTRLELSHAVPRIDVPALVIAGENDRLTPPGHARRIAEALPRLEQLVILPETGHMGPLERPEEIAEALVGLARSAGVGVSAAVV
jgi:pimeloyl-ACP methyl ester carboxylesterase